MCEFDIDKSLGCKILSMCSLPLNLLPLKMGGISSVNVVTVVFVSIQGAQSVNLALTKAWDVKILIPNNVVYVWSTIEVATIEDDWV